jgi:spore coat protein H
MPWHEFVNRTLRHPREKPRTSAGLDRPNGPPQGLPGWPALALVVLGVIAGCDSSSPQNAATTPFTPTPDAGEGEAGDGSNSEPAVDAGAHGGDGDVTLPSDAGADASVKDPSAALFPDDRLLEIEISVDPDDWDTIRHEGRTINSVFSGCEDHSFEYSEVEASLRVDGETLGRVGLRKKGFIGSLSSLKPALHVDINEFVTGQTLRGLKSLTLNNSWTDTSLAHTCMAYAVFAAVGIPAPRCAFARVTVNGKFLGTYVNVEPVKKPFLEKHFGDDSGDLYEGSAPADFRTDMLSNFEKKTNEDSPQGPELLALAQALKKPDAEVLAALDRVVDLEAFYHYWATEVLVGHHDGYSGNRNNFFIYVRPDDRKIVFMPWGPDDALKPSTAPGPESVYALGLLANRLYGLPETRERFRKTLREVLEQHWDEDVLLAQVDHISTLIGEEAFVKSLDELRTFIGGREASLLKELDAEAPAWTATDYEELACHPELNTPIRGTIHAPWGDPNALENAVDTSFQVVVNGQELNQLLAASGAGLQPDVGRPTSIFRITSYLLDGSVIVVQLILQGRDHVEPGVIPFHSFETFGVVLTGPSFEKLTLIGFVNTGAITFSAAGGNKGDDIRASFEGQMFAIPTATAL